MPVKIRLMRLGSRKRPFYRVVAVDEQKKRTGSYLELLGTYNPLTQPKEIKLEQDKIDQWMKKGAQPSTGFLRIIGKAPQRLPRKPKKAPKEEPAAAPAPAPEPVAETPAETAPEEITETTEVSQPAAETNEVPEAPVVETPADAAPAGETEAEEPKEEAKAEDQVEETKAEEPAEEK